MNVTFTDEQDDPLQPELLAELAEIVLRGESFPERTEVAITLVSAARMADLNEAHMGKRGPTDVLSFPLEDLAPGVVPDASLQGPPVLLGDVVICPSVVGERARSAEAALEDEMALMVVHGVLHLLGYDHEEDVDAEIMEAREAGYLAAVGRERP